MKVITEFRSNSSTFFEEYPSHNSLFWKGLKIIVCMLIASYVCIYIYNLYFDIQPLQLFLHCTCVTLPSNWGQVDKFLCVIFFMSEMEAHCRRLVFHDKEISQVFRWFWILVRPGIKPVGHRVIATQLSLKCYAAYA